MVDHARAIHDRLQRREITGLAPALARAEVASSLAGAAHIGRITWESAQQGLSSYLGAGLSQEIDPGWLLHAALETVRTLPVSAYDAMYLSLADSIGAWFVSGDDRARRGLAGRVPNFIWLGDVPL